jgi:hypothetical protein
MKQVSHEIQSGCIFISGAVEFDDRTGPVRDALETSVKTWLAAVEHAISLAVAEKHLTADTCPSQVMFEIHGLILALHYEARFFKSDRSLGKANTGFNNLLKQYII